MIEKLIEQEMEEYLDAAYADYGSAKNCLELFANAVIEILVKDLEHTKERYKEIANEEDKALLDKGECSAYWSHVSALAGAIYDIRNLKVKL